MSSPALVRVSRMTAPRGVVLMLHGGAEHNPAPVTEKSKSLWRSRLMYDAIHRRLEDAGLAVALLRFGTVGWNDPLNPSPVPDAQWALGELRREFDRAPVVLLGHSMGARTALKVAGEADVIGVVGLAPWFPPDEDVSPIAGKHLVAAHGSRDRITYAKATRQLLTRAEPVAASTRFVDMGPIGHYMLRRRRHWDRVAVDQTRAVFDVTQHD